MANYKHGTYGEFAESIGEVATQSGTVAVYVGIAPVNLIRGFSERVNAPVKLSDMKNVQEFMGYSKNWAAFDLCEAFHVHFANPIGNAGPIVAINVLDPETHKKSAETTKSVSFVNGRAAFESDTIILDTLVVADSVEGTDFTISYDFTRGQVVLTSIGDALSGSVNVTYSEVDVSMVDAEDIIGGATDAGVYTGLGCVGLIYQELNLIPNLLVCPGWGDKPEVYKAMIEAGTKINGHWDAFVYADIPVSDASAKVDTISLAKKWKSDNNYTNERSKVFWPKAKDNAGNIYHASVLGAWRTVIVDASHDGIPMESPSNKAVPVVKQYFGEESTNRGFDQHQANDLNANGITTIVYWGGLWVLWGPHTAAFKHGEIADNRSIFDNSIRMMMYISNSFQEEHALSIDQPMTRAMADTIKNREQEKMDALAAVGAIIGTPKVDFLPSENGLSSLIEGDFVWNVSGTTTPPFKSGTLKVAYTTAGFNSFFGEVE
jgi:phage tail sheath protein FI